MQEDRGDLFTLKVIAKFSITSVQLMYKHRINYFAEFALITELAYYKITNYDNQWNKL